VATVHLKYTRQCEVRSLNWTLKPFWSWTAANDFDAKKFSKMNTHSAREFTMVTPAQLLRNWRKQRPINHTDLHSSVAGLDGRGMGLLLISFLYRSTSMLFGWVLSMYQSVLLLANETQQKKKKEFMVTALYLLRRCHCPTVLRGACHL
jgi:hypothetical protein